MRSGRPSRASPSGDRVVVPFNISCGSCFMCDQGLQSQCETTQVREHGSGAALFGYTKLYGAVAGGQAELLRVPHADYGPIKVPEGPPGRPLRLPVRRAADRVAGRRVRRRSRGRQCRRARARPDRRHGGAHRPPSRRRHRDRRRPCPGAPAAGAGAVAPTSSTSPATSTSSLRCSKLTGGRGPDAVIDAVGMEAHGSPAGQGRPHDGPLPARLARREAHDDTPASTASPRCTRRSTSSVAAARSRSSACTAA